jgi:hypothetical protein
MRRLITFIISLGICSLAAADTIKANIKGRPATSARPQLKNIQGSA